MLSSKLGDRPFAEIHCFVELGWSAKPRFTRDACVLAPAGNRLIKCRKLCEW